MNCLVCKKEFEGEVCPRCKFPVIHFPGSTEEGLKAIEPTVKKYKNDFLNSIELYVKSYSWKDQNGMLVLDKTSSTSFGKADTLIGKKVFLEEKFARIKDKTVLPISVEVRIGEAKRELTVEVPNLFEPELQQIGIEFGEDFRFRLLLKNDAENVSVSGYQNVLV